MSEERLRIKTAVYIIFQKGKKILFLRRHNTGWSDGLFSLPSGHIDEGEKPIEASIREVKEEVLIDLQPSDLKFAHVMYEQDTYADFYFVVKNWQSEPKLGEPDKSDKIEWLDIEKDSKLIVPKVLSALQYIKSQKIYSEISAS